jgi:hypothetical protein
MDYKEMIKLRALELELHKQYGLVSKQISKYVADGKPLNIQYEVLHKIKDFYRDSAAEINNRIENGR